MTLYNVISPVKYHFNSLKSRAFDRLMCGMKLYCRKCLKNGIISYLYSLGNFSKYFYGVFIKYFMLDKATARL